MTGVTGKENPGTPYLFRHLWFSSDLLGQQLSTGDFFELLYDIFISHRSSCFPVGSKLFWFVGSGLERKSEAS